MWRQLVLKLDVVLAVQLKPFLLPKSATDCPRFLPQSFWSCWPEVRNFKNPRLLKQSVKTCNVALAERIPFPHTDGQRCSPNSGISFQVLLRCILSKMYSIKEHTNSSGLWSACFLHALPFSLMYIPTAIEKFLFTLQRDKAYIQYACMWHIT